jgi:hypothetical protein
MSEHGGLWDYGCRLHLSLMWFRRVDVTMTFLASISTMTLHGDRFGEQISINRAASTTAK